ncbi:hypothetical protein PCO82_02355 [Pectobacteriaceae bacterium CE90]|nr:hypothetical protein PCO82_02355 [Pectobacteriaceae bacterium CE90]
MNGINQFGTSTVQQTQVSAQGTINKTSATTSEKTNGTIDAQTSAKTQVSSLSHLLSDAANRATARDANTSRDGLAAIAQSTVNKLLGDSYRNNKAVYDAEVPASDDPQRLAQARQATDFTNGKGVNPFKGMSRDQLALITYDDSGAFTINERRAAWLEAYDQHEAWSRAISQKIMDEYNRSGEVSSKTYQEILDYYQSLPAIEEAQLPKGYDTQLQTRIQQANSAESSQHKNELESLLELLAQRVGGNKQA